jgi:hypothetical protein
MRRAYRPLLGDEESVSQFPPCRHLGPNVICTGRRLNKHASKGADAEIESHSAVLEGIMQQFRLYAMLRAPAEGSDLSSMEYAAGAGLDTSKRCLQGTQNGLLSEIKSWIRTTGEDVPRILSLSGTAGKGKSSIAHTIAT